ncbi:uncharacterized protein IL334_005199 [Kwoniella shivajii]|uniref:Uncharacterized protein n=1 Tax=Kwoniella shivajii TaxID=564305 RepID=A0ABZ1D2P4_9TREE|nr:hypothetical protein IL334_005199 [Kwoniella shivajii]
MVVKKEYQYPDPTLSGYTPSDRIWARTSPGGKFIYWLYIWFLIPFLVIISLLLAIPYLFFRSSRPLLPSGQKPDPAYTQRSRYHPDDPRSCSKYEWYGPKKPFPADTCFVPIGQGPGLHRRTWEVYGYLRDYVRMIINQALQIGGVVTALIIGFMQVNMMVHDLTDDVIINYKDTVGSTNNDPAVQLRTDPKCAYGVGTGVANWGNDKEPLVWYSCYHIFLIFLCISLLGDELFNVRFGCFAPQWFRAGNGYTMMFLVSATLTTSPNWGWTETMQFRYLVLVIIFILGVYNVTHTLLSSFGIPSDDYKDADVRTGRKPLRPWSEKEWDDEWFRMNFIPSTNQRHFLTERIQAKLGDWNFPLEKRPRENIEKQIAILEKENQDYDDGRIQKVWQKTPEDIKRQAGKIGRTIIHGAPKKLPYHFMEDLRQRKRFHKPPINPRNPPTEEEEQEIMKALDQDKGYFGIANWKPRTKSYGWWWFDVRRVHYMICATALFGVRIGLCFFDLGPQAYSAYLEEYQLNQFAWKVSGGPNPSKCQYYQGSSMPIFILLSGSAHTGVMTSLVWMGVWHAFMLGMCIAIFMVALSNNMWWGIHMPFPPITLIGPRMTSMSMGITLGFVAFATLQQGFYFHNDSLILLTKVICYSSVVGFILSFFPNEPLRSDYTRDPFWPWSSRFAMRMMDRKKWHYSFKDDGLIAQ